MSFPYSRSAFPIRHGAVRRSGGAPSYFRFLVAALVWFCLVAPPSPAQLTIPSLSSSPQDTAETTPKPEPTVEERQTELRTKIKAMDDRIDAAAARETQEQADQLGLSLSALQDRTLGLRQLRSVYEDHLSTLDQLQETRRMVDDLAREKAEYQGPTEPPPYTPWYVDTFRDAVSAKEVQLNLDKQSVELAQNRLERTKSDLTKAEASVALARNQAAASSDRSGMPDLENKVQSAQSNVELLKATVSLNELQVQVAQEKANLREKQLEFEKQKLADAVALERYRPEDLDKKKEDIAKARADLNAKLKDAIKEKDDAQSALSEARDAQAQAATDQTTAAASMDLLRARSNAATDKVTSLRDRLDYLLRQEDMWSTRYKLHLGGDLSIPDEIQRAEDYADFLNSILQTRTADLEGVRASLREWDRKASAGPDQETDTSLARKIVQVLNGHLDLFRSGLTALTAQQQINKHLLDDLQEAQHHLSLGERLGQIWGATANIWYQELPVDIGGEPLSVRQIVLATLILVIGFGFTRAARRYLHSIVRSRTHVDLNAAASIERLIHYFLLILVVLFAMSMVGIPLTAFTIFGGALAIGVGFGAQNLINNFISGLILMMERPIRIGDLVEVDGRSGFIEEIGARCSRLRQFSGVDILVPNSSFLEKSVINWTLSDARVRWEIRVGVAYGSNTREAQKLILKAVEEHGRVLDEPEPLVVFSDFGDSALIFDAYFWLTMGPATDPRVVRSDIRHRIDKLLKEAGIVIAFPQRDVHLDVVGPIEIRTAQAEPPEAEERPSLPGGDTED